MELDIEILFIDELLVISEGRTLDFSNSDLFVDGRNKENRQTQDLRNCEPVSDICVWQYSRK